MKHEWTKGNRDDDKPTYLADLKEQKELKEYEERIVKAIQDSIKDMEDYLVNCDLKSTQNTFAERAIVAIKKSFKPDATKQDIDTARQFITELEARNKNVPLEGHNHYTLAKDIPPNHQPCTISFENTLKALGSGLDYVEKLASTPKGHGTTR